MSLIKNESFIVVEEKVLCSKGCGRPKLVYDCYCRECRNKYNLTYRHLVEKQDRELGKGDYLYYIVNTKTGIMCYTGKSHGIILRYKDHLEELTSTFGRMLRATGGDPKDYKMYILDLSHLGLTKSEVQALEHNHNYANRETVVNSDIKVTTKDINILSNLEDRGILDEIDTLEWVEYNEFMNKKNTHNSISSGESKHFLKVDLV